MASRPQSLLAHKFFETDLHLFELTRRHLQNRKEFYVHIACCYTHCIPEDPSKWFDIFNNAKSTMARYLPEIIDKTGSGIHKGIYKTVLEIESYY